MLIGFIGIFLILYFEATGKDYDFYRMFCYLSIFAASWSMVYWKIIIYINNHLLCGKSSNLLTTKIVDFAFGIYLIHILIMREWLWKTEFILNISNYYSQTLTILFITFSLSLLSCFIISKIPYLRSIIGLNIPSYKNIE